MKDYSYIQEQYNTRNVTVRKHKNPNFNINGYKYSCYKLKQSICLHCNQLKNRDLFIFHGRYINMNGKPTCIDCFKKEKKKV